MKSERREAKRCTKIPKGFYSLPTIDAQKCPKIRSANEKSRWKPSKHKKGAYQHTFKTKEQLKT
jgi:hypothetical protein